MLAVIDGTHREESGGFFDYRGERLPLGSLIDRSWSATSLRGQMTQEETAMRQLAKILGGLWFCCQGLIFDPCSSRSGRRGGRRHPHGHYAPARCLTRRRRHARPTASQRREFSACFRAKAFMGMVRQDYPSGLSPAQPGFDALRQGPARGRYRKLRPDRCERAVLARLCIQWEQQRDGSWKDCRVGPLAARRTRWAA